MQASHALAAALALCGCNDGDKNTKTAVTPQPKTIVDDARPIDAQPIDASRSDAYPIDAQLPVDATVEVHGPLVVTQRLMRKLAQGKIPVRDVINSKTGAMLVQFDTGGGAENARATKRISPLCGDKVTQVLQRALKVIERNLEIDGEIDCSNKPTHHCTIWGRMEYEITVELHFRKPTGAQGVTIATIALIERSGGMSEAWNDQGEALLTKALAKEPNCP